MSRFEVWFSTWIVHHRWWFLLAIPLLVVAAASGARHLEFTNDYRVFFSKENPQLQAFETLENTYNKQDNILIMLAPGNREVFTRKTLAAVRELTEAAWQIPHSLRVDSIANFQHTYADGDELVVEDLVYSADSLSDDDLLAIRLTALHEPLLVNRLVSADGSVTAVNITIELPGIDEHVEGPQAVAHARELVQRLESEYPDIRFFSTGMVIMNNTFAEQSRADMASLVPISFAAMLLVLGFMLRSLSGMLATVLVILMSIATGLGLGGYIGFPLTPPSAASPTIILTMAIASSVHILVSYYHNLRLGQDRQRAMSESLRINLQPVFLTSLTTIVGFLSMNFSDAPPFRHLGNIVAIGVAASFVLAVGFLPALMLLLPARPGKVNTLESRWMNRFGDFVVRRHNILFWGMAVVVVLLVSQVPRNQLNDIFVNYFDETVDFRVDSDEVDKNLGGLYRIDYSLDSGASNGISDPEFLQKVDRLANWLREQPHVVHVNTITDVLRRLNRNLHSDDQNWYRLPENRELTAQYLLLYEMSLPYGLDLNNQINVDKSATRITVTMHKISTKEVLALEERVQQWFEANAPELATHGSSPTIMFAHIGARNIRTMLWGTTVALVVISLILVVALRSVKIGLTSMIPNLVPAGMAFGLWGMTVGEVGLALSVVTGMTLGIVVDDTVHFLSKYLRARREQQLAPGAAVRYAFSSVGLALFITSLVLIIGFAILSFSHFQLNSGMGLLTAVVLFFALLADFLFLPPLLIKIEGNIDAAPPAAAPQSVSPV